MPTPPDEASTPSPDWLVRPLRRRDYAEALEAMRAFTAARTPDTPDEIWLIEHPPVFTLGQAARIAHLRDPAPIPVVQTERGGQVTYHGPGQLVAYLLLDLRRRGLMIRDLVCRIESALIDTLADAGIDGVRRPGAPGIYLRGQDGSAGAKIAALGLKVSRGCTYHGLSLNVDMDLRPFERIDPCGYPGLAVTDMASAPRGSSTGGRRDPLSLEVVAAALVRHLRERIGEAGCRVDDPLAGQAFNK